MFNGAIGNRKGDETDEEGEMVGCFAIHLARLNGLVRDEKKPNNS